MTINITEKGSKTTNTKGTETMNEYNRFIEEGLSWETYLMGASDAQLSRMLYDIQTLKEKVWYEISDRETKRKDATCIDKIGDQAWIFEFDELCNHTTNVFPNRKLICDSNYMTVEQAREAILRRYPKAKIAYSNQYVSNVMVLFQVNA